MEDERKVVLVGSGNICGTNISTIIEALRNNDIVILDDDIIDPLEDKKEIFELTADYNDVIEKSKKNHNWKKKNFWD